MLIRHDKIFKPHASSFKGWFVSRDRRLEGWPGRRCDSHDHTVSSYDPRWPCSSWNVLVVWACLLFSDDHAWVDPWGLGHCWWVVKLAASLEDVPVVDLEWKLLSVDWATQVSKHIYPELMFFHRTWSLLAHLLELIGDVELFVFHWTQRAISFLCRLDNIGRHWLPVAYRQDHRTEVRCLSAGHHWLNALDATWLGRFCIVVSSFKSLWLLFPSLAAIDHSVVIWWLAQLVTRRTGEHFRNDWCRNLAWFFTALVNLTSTSMSRLHFRNNWLNQLVLLVELSLLHDQVYLDRATDGCLGGFSRIWRENARSLVLDYRVNWTRILVSLQLLSVRCLIE